MSLKTNYLCKYYKQSNNRVNSLEACSMWTFITSIQQCDFLISVWIETCYFLFSVCFEILYLVQDCFFLSLLQNKIAVCVRNRFLNHLFPRYDRGCLRFEHFELQLVFHALIQPRLKSYTFVFRYLNFQTTKESVERLKRNKSTSGSCTN